MTDNHIDVLINGCGIGGAMLAYLLGRQGHRVVVVEQARRERAINGADLLKPAGIRVVEAAGLLAEVTRRGGRVRDELEVYHDGELLRYFNYSSVDARGYFILMPCESLRRLVLEKIDGEATVEMLFETRIEAVQRDERHAIDQVRLNDGRVLRPRVVVEPTVSPPTCAAGCSISMWNAAPTRRRCWSAPSPWRPAWPSATACTWTRRAGWPTSIRSVSTARDWW